MAGMADNSARIAEIQQILRAGVASQTTDGVTTAFDIPSLRKELRQLMAEDDTQAGRRPASATIKVTGL